MPPIFFCLLIFITPILRLLLALCTAPKFFIKRSTPNNFSPATLKINWVFGLMEYVIGAIRNLIVGIIAIIGVFSADHAPISLFCLILILHSSNHYAKASLNIAEFLRANPKMHPQGFFRHFVQSLGVIHYLLPEPQAEPTINPVQISFKKHTRAQLRLWVFLQLVWDTTHLAQIALKSRSYVGPDYAREIFDPMASMWGKRMLEVFQAAFRVSGTERLEGLRGKCLLLFNHKSQLDFALSFFALSDTAFDSRDKFKPRFITAKDHFVDNPIVYEVMGVGKLIESADMVFIDRKHSETGRQNMQQAATFLVEKDIDIAIFPQGTRAEGNVDRSEKRRDSGYYTTFSRKSLADDHGHLKKGSAFLAVDTLLELQARGLDMPLHLVFIGIMGTGCALPKGSIRLQTESDIEYRVGSVLTLHPNQVASFKKEDLAYLDFVKNLHAQIDTHLVSAIGLHAHLRHRFLVDLKGHFGYTGERIQLAEMNLDRVSTKHPIAYRILDRIYALKTTEQWNPYLSELAQLLMEESSQARLQELLVQVSEELRT